MRITSDTDRPMALSASVARALVSLSILARTTVSAFIWEPPYWVWFHCRYKSPRQQEGCRSPGAPHTITPRSGRRS